jgi:hypothetical protein
MAMTTRSSISVKAEVVERLSCEVIVCLRCGQYGNPPTEGQGRIAQARISTIETRGEDASELAAPKAFGAALRSAPRSVNWEKETVGRRDLRRRFRQDVVHV